MYTRKHIHACAAHGAPSTCMYFIVFCNPCCFVSFICFQLIFHMCAHMHTYSDDFFTLKATACHVTPCKLLHIMVLVSVFQPSSRQTKAAQGESTNLRGMFTAVYLL